MNLRNLLAVIVMGLSPLANSQVETYGNLFLVEEKIDLTNSFNIGVFGGSTLNTAAFSSYSAGMKIHYFISPFIFVGGDGAKNFLNKSDNFSLIEKELKYEGEVVARHPVSEFYATFGIVPIKGNLNLFNKRSQTFYVMLGLSGGIAQLSNSSWVPAYDGAANLRFDINSHWGIDFALRQKMFYFNGSSEMSLHLQWGLSYFLF